MDLFSPRMPVMVSLLYGAYSSNDRSTTLNSFVLVHRALCLLHTCQSRYANLYGERHFFIRVTMWLVLPRGLRHDWSKSLTRLLFISISSLPSKKSPSRPSSALRRSPSRPFIPGKFSSVHSLAKRSCPSDLVLSRLFINSSLEISNLHFSSWNHRSRRPGLGFLRISPRIWYRSVLFFFLKVMRSIWWQINGFRFVFYLFRSASYSRSALPIRWA